MGIAQQLLICGAAAGGGGGSPENLLGSGSPSVTEFSFAAELGMRFYADVNGDVTKLRFLCAPNGVAAGTTLTLWSDAGSNLGSVAIGAAASGWNEATLSSPVSLTASTIYVVSYVAPAGWAIYDTTLSSPLNNGSHLYSAGSGNNGVYVAGTGFPNQNGAGQNYYADVVFVPD